MPPLIKLIHKGKLQDDKKLIQSRQFEEIPPALLQDLDEAFMATLELMKQGKNIYRGVLMDEHWVGMPDLLEAHPVSELGKQAKSNFGDYYYVAYDIKAGPEIRTEYKFPIVFYSLILERIQGVRPRDGYIINSDGEERSFMVDDFVDQFNISLTSIEKILEGEKPPPFLKSGCKHSPWYSLCESEAKDCDDVSLIYRISQADQKQLYDIGIRTVRDLASADIDELHRQLQFWNFDKLLRFHNQANALLGNKHMVIKKPDFPEVKNEIYFDIESDPTVGIDYLWGLLIKSGASASRRTEYKYFWADDKEGQKKLWEDFLGFIQSLDDFVIYYYSSYEKQVFDRFAGRFGISRGLEAKFKDNSIDLHNVLVNSVILPLYFYSLKDVARFLGFDWQAEDAGGAESVVWYNNWLKTDDAQLKDKIIEYNEDDVKATLFIKEWLEGQGPKKEKIRETLPEE